jgi:hypothetical protein
VHNDALPDGLTALVPGEVVLAGTDPVVAEEGAGELGESLREQPQRFAWMAERGALVSIERQRWMCAVRVGDVGGREPVAHLYDQARS